LKSQSFRLYSSAAQPQSTLKLSPGQWVAMRIKFRLLIDEEKPSHSLAAGPAELRIEWGQADYTWRRKGCQITSSFLSYFKFYEEITDPVKILVVSTKEDEAQLVHGPLREEQKRRRTSFDPRSSGANPR